MIIPFSAIKQARRTVVLSTGRVGRLYYHLPALKRTLYYFPLTASLSLIIGSFGLFFFRHIIDYFFQVVLEVVVVQGF
jgi:hypothetical protein